MSAVDREAVRVEVVDAAGTYALRHAVLRPGLPETSTRFEGDDHPLVAHVAALADSGAGPKVVSVGTIFPDPVPWAPDEPNAWRIRGMATAEGCRGRGIGRLVLDGLVAHAEESGGTFVWCHARAGAFEFYERAGFVAVGETFHDGIAVHRSMYRRLAPADRNFGSA